MAWGCCMLAVVSVLLCVCFQDVDCAAINGSGAVTGTCQTPVCANSAAELIKNMNLSANPCEDFNEFACGRFLEESEFEPGEEYASLYSPLIRTNTKILIDIMEAPITAADPKYLTNIKRFYKSCMNEEQIDNLGVAPYLNNTEFSHDWPTINDKWSDKNFDLNEVIARYMVVDIQPLFSFTVEPDTNDSSINVIKISDGELGLTQEMFAKERTDPVIMAYEKYLTEIAIELNAPRNVAEEDAKEVVDLEYQLAKIMVPTSGKTDSTKRNNPVKLNELHSYTPKLDLARAIKATFETVNITLAKDERLLNQYPSYLANLSTVVHRFSNRTVQNLFGFKFAETVVRGLTTKMRNIEEEFYTAIFGGATQRPRNEVCYSSASSSFWKGVSKQFVLKQFPGTAKIYVNKLIDNLILAFRSMIDEAKWMSQKSKEGAAAKLTAMKRKVGYPDENFEEADIEKLYEDYIMDENHFYNNKVIIQKLSRHNELKSLRKPAKMNEWLGYPHEFNTFYSRSRNEIVLLAGLLQPPYFVEKAQNYLTYGLIGFITGHEITHSFDDMGSQYDKNGNLGEFWTPEDRKKFREKAQCIVDQNFATNVEEVGMTLNGNNTQSETVADRGGLKEAHRAYKIYVKEHGEELLLPGLQLTQEKLFFVSFAQIGCQKYTLDLLKLVVENFEDLPGKYRINGILQNSEEFAKVYNCPQGSFMNPEKEKKCYVW